MKITHWVSHIAMASALYLAVGAVIATEAPNTKTETMTTDKKTVTKTSAKGDTIVAKVNGKEIKLSEVKALENALPQQIKAQIKDQSKIYKLLVSQLADITLLTAESKQAGLENDADVKEAIAKATEQVIIQAYLAKFIKSKVTETTARAFYDNEVKNLPKDAMEVKARHILVKDEKTAQDIIKKLNNGADFLKLARDYSIDKGSATNGGDIGYFQKNEMVPEFVTAAFALEAGKYTKEPVKTQFGYHIIKVDDRRKVKAKKFEEEAERVQGTLTEKAMGDLVKELRSKAKIEFFDQNGKPMKIDLDEKSDKAEDASDDAAQASAAPAA